MPLRGDIELVIWRLTTSATGHKVCAIPEGAIVATALSAVVSVIPGLCSTVEVEDNVVMMQHSEMSFVKKDQSHGGAPISEG